MNKECGMGGGGGGAGQGAGEMGGGGGGRRIFPGSRSDLLHNYEASSF